MSMKKITMRVCLWLGTLFAASGAYAATLNLTSGFPDFYLNSVNYSYAVGTGSNPGTFTLTGTIGSYTQCSGCVQSSVTSNGSYLDAITFTAHVNHSTGAFIDGSFKLDGVVRQPFPTILYDGSTSPSGLLSGALTNFGWAGSSNTSGILEFTFNNPTGAVPSALGIPSSTPCTKCGLILTVSSSSGFGAGSTSFNNAVYSQSWTGAGYGDAFVVPLPPAVWLFGSGLAFLLRFTRRRAAGRETI